VVKQHTESQYDDDLTLGSDDYDDSYYTDGDDLFELSTDNESPISRLKSLVLSIDWEITDDVLRQFNEELVDLRSIWAGETINLVYVQALEKLSKYIYQNKADSHPSAIKLLLTFYYNLEKIVSSPDLPEEQKKEILLEDVKRFENLKRQIKVQPVAVPTVTPPVTTASANITKPVVSESELLNLKAIVLGIDWEITEQDLNNLRKEVFRLEEKYAESRPKLILLQGIGTLAAYIKVKKSNSHPDAFKILQYFYECLESIAQKHMSFEEEKAILFPAVEKFNAFKLVVGPTIAAQAVVPKDEDDVEEEEMGGAAAVLSPALSDVDEETERGFQADHEAVTLGLKDPASVTSHIDHFFGENDSAPAPLSKEFVAEVREEPTYARDLFAEEGDTQPVNIDVALQGVDVGEDEEEDFEHDEGVDLSSPVAAISGDTVALADVEAEEVEEDEESAVVRGMDSAEKEILGATEAIFPKALEEALVVGDTSPATPNREMALLGVDVETEADDDSDEASLPMMGEELAPALLAADEESLFSASSLEKPSLAEGLSEDISGTIDSLFENEVPKPIAEKVTESVAEEATSDQETALLGVDVETEADDDSDEASLPMIGEELAPALLVADEESLFNASSLEKASLSEGLSEDISGTIDTLFENEVPKPIAEEVTESVAKELSVADQLLEEAPVVFDWQDEKVMEAREEGAKIAEEATEMGGDDLFAALDTKDESAETLYFSETGEEETLSADSPAEVVETDEAIAAFFAEDQSESDAAVDESDIADLFDSLETDFSSEQMEATAKVTLEEATAKTDTTPAAETEIGGAIMAGVITAALTGTVAAAAAEDREEEVVFELVEEKSDEEPLIFATEDSGGMAPPLTKEVGESVEASALDEDGPQWASPMSLPIQMEEPLPQAPLAGLAACIDSLKLEICDTILNGMFAEINALRQQWNDRPLGKTFLQLISTVTQHIDSYRYESSAEAHGLLVSTYQSLAALSSKNERTNQEMLLVATLKVLEWQQGMLSRQALRVGGQLTFADPLRTESWAVGGGVDDAVPEEQGLGQQGHPELAISAETPIHLTGDAGSKGSLISDSFAGDLKNEIAALRQALQMEIAELRRELRGDEKKGDVA
jgi:pilus assembly protein FimV